MRLIALYLPQFHRIPENDLWWGENFTEWTNVRRGKAYYKGHYQPRVPYKNRYYDLSEEETLRRQIMQARRYGISGFCFYHYYFCGKLLLEKPAERFLKCKDMDIEFCFSWANQSWMRTWYGDGSRKGTLLKQTYGGEEEWKEHFRYLLPFFQDKRYIKIKNKPVFLIYLPQDFKMFARMKDIWNSLACAEGFDGVYFIAMDTVYQSDTSIKRFDAIVEFEPLCTIKRFPMWLQTIRDLKKSFRKKLNAKKQMSGFFNWLSLDNACSYGRASKYIMKRKHNRKEKIYLGAFPGWDNTPRKDESGLLFSGSTPEKFEKLLTRQIEKSFKLGNELLFINAWNEWSEGAYLEPDQKYGYAYLNAVKRALENCSLKIRRQ